MQITKQAIFMVGEEEYGLDILEVISIEKVVPVRKVIGFSKNIKGIINLRGELVPVYSLRGRFGMEEIPANDDTRFIVTRSGELIVAFEVDRMKEILQMETEQLYETPAIVGNKDTDYIRCISKIDDRLAIIINSRNILTEEERAQIKSVVEKERDRKTL